MIQLMSSHHLLKKTEISFSTRFDPSIYETNKFLVNRRFLLTEYAAFFGSIQIMKYLFENKAKISPYIWLYAVHSQNSEVIQFLVEIHIQPKDDNYEESFIEAIKCHHNETANFINNKLLKTVEVEFYNAFYPRIKYYNFAFLHDNLIKKSVIFDLCRYDYS